MSVLVADNTAMEITATTGRRQDIPRTQLKLRLTAICEKLSEEYEIRITPHEYTRNSGEILQSVCTAQIVDVDKDLKAADAPKRYVTYINITDIEKGKIDIEDVERQIKEQINQITDTNVSHEGRHYLEPNNSFTVLSKSVICKLANIGWRLVNIKLANPEDQHQAKTAINSDVIKHTAIEINQRLLETCENNEIVSYLEIGCWNANGIKEIIEKVVQLNNGDKSILSRLSIIFDDISEAAYETAREKMIAIHEEYPSLTEENIIYGLIKAPESTKVDVLRAVNVFDAIPADLYVYLEEEQTLGELQVKTYFDENIFQQNYKEADRKFYPELDNFDTSELIIKFVRRISEFNNEETESNNFLQALFNEKDQGTTKSALNFSKTVKQLARGLVEPEEVINPSNVEDEHEFIKSFAKEIHNLSVNEEPTTKQISTTYKIWILLINSLRLDTQIVPIKIDDGMVLNTIYNQAKDSNLSTGTILPVSEESSPLIDKVLNTMKVGAISIFPNLHRVINETSEKTALPMIRGATFAYFVIDECFHALVKHLAKIQGVCTENMYLPIETGPKTLCRIVFVGNIPTTQNPVE